MSDRREIMLAGLGGQGVVLAGVLLGRAGAAAGLYVAGSNSYGAQARGSACKAEVVLSPSAIDYPHAEAPDILVAMSQGGYDAFAETVREGGLILYDDGLATPRRLRAEAGFPVTALALKELGGKQAANVLWAGLAAGVAGWFERSVLEEALAVTVPERFLKLNQKALVLGWDLGRDWKEAQGGR